MLSRSACFIIASAGFVPAAHAAFLNHPIDASYRIDLDGHTYLDNTEEQRVTNDTEFVGFTGGGPSFDIDVADDTIHVSNFSNPDTFESDDFNGIVLSDPNDAIPPFATFAVLGTTTMHGLEASRLSHDDDHLNVNWGGLSFTPETVVDLAVTFGKDSSTDPVPSPDAAPVGLAILFLTLRARRPRPA